MKNAAIFPDEIWDGFTGTSRQSLTEDKSPDMIDYAQLAAEIIAIQEFITTLPGSKMDNKVVQTQIKKQLKPIEKELKKIRESKLEKSENLTLGKVDKEFELTSKLTSLQKQVEAVDIKTKLPKELIESLQQAIELSLGQQKPEAVKVKDKYTVTIEDLIIAEDNCKIFLSKKNVIGITEIFGDFQIRNKKYKYVKLLNNGTSWSVLDSE